MSFSTFDTPNYTQFTNDESNAHELTANPRLYASFLSTITFHWMNSLVIKGYKKDPLEIDDLHELHPVHKSNFIGSRFSKMWGYSDHSSGPDELNIQVESDERRKTSVWSSLLKCLAPYFVGGVLIGIIADLCEVFEPYLLKWLLNFMADTHAPQWHGYLIVFSVATLGLIGNLATGQAYHRLINAGIMSKTAINYLIYRKALRVSVASRAETTTGEIVNLMSVDAGRFQDVFCDADIVFSGIIRISFSLYFLYYELGNSLFAGLAVLLVLLPVTTYLVKVMENSQTTQMERKDERIKLMNEILSGIKVIKLYAWEKSFSQLINDIRKFELKQLKVLAYLQAALLFIYTATPLFVALASFLTFVLSNPDNVLNSEKAFVSIAFFNVLRFPLNALPEIILIFVMAGVSNRRLKKFFDLPEMKKYVTNEQDEYTIRITDASFKYGEEISIEDTTDEQSNGCEPFELKGINMKIKEGSFVAIVGPVGSGKSSLLTAILGEMEKTSGRINILPEKSIAYVAQQAWIQNDSLKNNILFGSPLEEERYKKIVSGCQLLPDLEILPGGDETEIGEKGINLSGGQKQRLSLARACYSDRDIYLLDDPLSAVDSHVSKKLFNKILSSESGLLRQKTRLLVTNNLNILPMVDEIYVLSEGEITESGKYNELIESNGKFSDFVKQFSNTTQDGPSKQSPNLLRIKSHTSDASGLEDGINSRFTDSDEHRLIESERMEKGRVKLRVYFSYFRNVPLISLGILFLVLMAANELATNYWLSLWAEDGDSKNKSSSTFRLFVYCALNIITLILTLIGSIIMFRGAALCAMKMHSLLLSGVLRCPMKFFDTTPVGRILNRFSKDIEEIDDVLPDNVIYWLMCIIQSFFNILILVVFTPIFILFIIAVGLIYYGMMQLFAAANRSLQRLESIYRSPLYSHFSETLNGIVTIRAFNSSSRMINLSDNKLDTSQRVACDYNALNRWMMFRLKLIGTLIVTFTAIVAVMSRDKISPALTGLVFTYAISITRILDSMVMLTSTLESQIVSVERVLEYSSNEPEAEWESRDGCKPSTNWPSGGCIEFINYSTKYREGLTEVLKNLTFQIGAGEKIGIVGRTGAGKSSMTLALFRLLEPTSGTIVIDSVDITQIGLHDLREALTIIPQDPVLFCGKLRTNLDPFNKQTDDELWHALELAHLKDFVTELEGGLDYSVAEGGSNLSVGQRQLICLARALLKKTRILILDEATAAVDLQTDSLILATVRSQFDQCTILTIAHRLNTVIDSDRVLVLDQGQVVEFDSPVALMSDSSSLFYSLAKDAGLV